MKRKNSYRRELSKDEIKEIDPKLLAFFHKLITILSEQILDSGALRFTLNYKPVHCVVDVIDNTLTFKIQYFSSK